MEREEIQELKKQMQNNLTELRRKMKKNNTITSMVYTHIINHI